MHLFLWSYIVVVFFILVRVTVLALAPYCMQLSSSYMHMHNACIYMIRHPLW